MLFFGFFVLSMCSETEWVPPACFGCFVKDAKNVHFFATVICAHTGEVPTIRNSALLRCRVPCSVPYTTAGAPFGT